MSKLLEVIKGVIDGKEIAYSSPDLLEIELSKLIRYAIENRDEREVHPDELAASELISRTVSSLGFKADINIGRDLWELVSEDSQAQWLYPPGDREGVIISLINVANNMANSQCYIEFI